MPPLPAAQFYFTDVDPDYSIKGSRDPLGFQVIWQEQARQLVPYLSTVSRNLRDFQTLCLAHHLYEREPDTGFVRFFLRLEQLLAYVRYEMNDRTFNGLRKVERLFREGSALVVSNSKRDEILSNQRAYGIWGKYSRPFREMGLLQKEAFSTVFSHKVEGHPERAAFEKLINVLLVKSEVKVTPDMLRLMQPILYFTKEEKQFYRATLLQTPTPNNFQSQLYEFLQQEGPPAGFDLYAFLHAFKAFAGESALTEVLSDIEATEKVLCPLNRIFRLLQTRPLWTRADIEAEGYIAQCTLKSNHAFASASKESNLKNNLAATLQKSRWELVQDLVERNRIVTAQRGGAPWMTLSGEVVEVHHREGAFYDPQFTPERHTDNHYFLDTYVSLYHQIHAKS